MEQIHMSTNPDKILAQILSQDLYVDLDIDNIDGDASIRNDYGLDSLGFVELKNRIEQVFNLSIDDDNFNPDNFNSINSLSLMIKKIKL
jgi:acyl carrier protein